ncbi:MAG: peroxidase [Bryobacteraceae bacterium]|nr:peroxidase [Bryobacteraceae bacterium]
MDPMFLPRVEDHVGDDPYSQLAGRFRPAGRPYPQIWHLFAFKRNATKHLEAFTHEVMRGPSPLTPGLRELIAALTSARNQCPF